MDDRSPKDMNICTLALDEEFQPCPDDWHPRSERMLLHMPHVPDSHRTQSSVIKPPPSILKPSDPATSSVDEEASNPNNNNNNNNNNKRLNNSNINNLNLSSAHLETLLPPVLSLDIGFNNIEPQELLRSLTRSVGGAVVLEPDPSQITTPSEPAADNDSNNSIGNIGENNKTSELTKVASGLNLKNAGNNGSGSVKNVASPGGSRPGSSRSRKA